MAPGSLHASHQHLIKGGGNQSHLVFSKTYFNNIGKPFYAKGFIPHNLNRLVKDLHYNIPHLRVFIGKAQLPAFSELVNTGFNPPGHSGGAKKIIKCPAYFKGLFSASGLLSKFQQRPTNIISSFIDFLDSSFLIANLPLVGNQTGGHIPFLITGPAAAPDAAGKNIVFKPVDTAPVYACETCFQIAKYRFIRPVFIENIQHGQNQPHQRMICDVYFSVNKTGYPVFCEDDFYWPLIGLQISHHNGNIAIAHSPVPAQPDNIPGGSFNFREGIN